MGGLGRLGLGRAAAKAGGAATIMGLLLILLTPLVSRLIPPQGSGGQAGYILISIALGVSVYSIALVLMGAEEIRPLWRWVGERWRR